MCILYLRNDSWPELVVTIYSIWLLNCTCFQSYCKLGWKLLGWFLQARCLFSHPCIGVTTLKEALCSDANLPTFFIHHIVFSLLPSMLWHCWLGGRKGIRRVKNLSGGVLARLSVCSEVQTCIWPSWCHCHSLSLASVKSRLVLPFWYRLTCVCVCVCVRACVRACACVRVQQLTCSGKQAGK